MLPRRRRRVGVAPGTMVDLARLPNLTLFVGRCYPAELYTAFVEHDWNEGGRSGVLVPSAMSIGEPA